MHCRAAVIDEIELAQQLDHGGGTIVGSKFLEPYLHTISGTELTQLQKKQWGGKLRETKDLIAKLECSLTTRLAAIEKVPTYVMITTSHFRDPWSDCRLCRKYETETHDYSVQTLPHASVYRYTYIEPTRQAKAMSWNIQGSKHCFKLDSC